MFPLGRTPLPYHLCLRVPLIWVLDDRNSLRHWIDSSDISQLGNGSDEREIETNLEWMALFSPSHSVLHYICVPPCWWLITNDFQFEWSKGRKLPWEKGPINALVEQSKQRPSKWRLEQRHFITHIQGIHGYTCPSKGIHKGEIIWSRKIVCCRWIKNPRLPIIDPSEGFRVGRALILAMPGKVFCWFTLCI